MKVTGAKNNFRGLNNPKFLKSLEFVSDNNALISSGVMLLAGGVIRPIMTFMTPDTPKQNKKYAAANSISSALVGFGITKAFFTPITKSLNNVASNPEKFLNEKSIKKLQGNAKTLKESSAFNFLEQSIKMVSESLAVVPKAVLTTALIVPVLNSVFKNKNKKSNIQNEIVPNKANLNPNFSNLNNKTNIISFKGFSNKAISKVLNNDFVQDFAIKNKDKNIIQYLMNIKDVFATGCFVAATYLNPKIDKKDKKPLASNIAISTAFTITGGYIAKKMLDKPIDSFIEKLKKANPDNPKINKYINGIKVLEPILILSSIYYLISPVFSTYIAGKITNKENANGKNQ